ncbi:MAG: undecaprenyldiphospho-muramoylpentapeptide beta-N-acetylglucosaminyltransferase [Eggerthellaceae bacterium]|nr:undecaprenyldiphospho-muramoylpentapeptide beta-N-acetylglucosaminyltransferase [Eggerthellaceae bacterium]
MLAVLSGGGTAGHITPALALADELKRRGWDVRFAGTPQGVEGKMAQDAGIPFTAFEAAGFNRNHPTTIFRALWLIEKSTFAAKKWLSEIKPDVVVGFGGYVCIPVGRAAEKLGIPVVVHEQNSVMGMANKFLSKKAARVCLTYDHAASAVDDASKIVVTGNPVRTSVLEATREQGRDYLGVPDDALVLLVTGGSLGARHLNQAISAMKDALLAHENLYVVHVTGRKEYDSVAEALALTPEETLRYLLFDYQDHMGECMAAADAIVSRAGASSLAEISARGIPALLVPFPYATEDHQTINAQSLVEAGCAFMVPDAEVEGEQFASLVMKLVEDGGVRESMHAAALAQDTAGAAAALADEVERAASI